MFQLILEGRKRREVSPILEVLRECVAEARDPARVDAHARERLVELLAFFEMMTSWYEAVRRMPRSTLTKFIRMGDKVSRLLEAS
jgi:DNA-binding transcriptional regulator GbsR (MarR family)